MGRIYKACVGVPDANPRRSTIPSSAHSLVIKIQPQTPVSLQEIEALVQTQNHWKSVPEALGKLPKIYDYGSFVWIDSVDIVENDDSSSY